MQTKLMQAKIFKVKSLPKKNFARGGPPEGGHMVQHRAARFVLGRPWRRHQRDSITTMLSTLKWPVLYERRRWARLTLLYKLLHNLLQIPECYLPSLSTSRTRCHHNFKFTHYQTSINNYKYAFFPRTVPDWNNLATSSHSI